MVMLPIPVDSVPVVYWEEEWCQRFIRDNLADGLRYDILCKYKEGLANVKKMSVGVHLEQEGLNPNVLIAFSSYRNTNSQDRTEDDILLLIPIAQYLYIGHDGYIYRTTSQGYFKVPRDKLPVFTYMQPVLTMLGDTSEFDEIFDYRGWLIPYVIRKFFGVNIRPSALTWAIHSEYTDVMVRYQSEILATAVLTHNTPEIETDILREDILGDLVMSANNILNEMSENISTDVMNFGPDFS
jgi:hypothetical protein